MKKVFAFILAFVYLSSSVGATVHLHYCMDKLINWSLNEEGDKCTNCGMEKDGACCKDENKFLKNNLDQSVSGAIELIQASSIDPYISFVTIPDNYSLSFVNENPTSHAPPLNCGADILIRNCIFRI